MIINEYYIEDKKNGNWSTFYMEHLENNILTHKKALSEARMTIYQADLFIKEMGWNTETDD